MNILYLEKRGMNFVKNDERVSGSDVGNYRVCTEDYIVRGKNGRDYYLDISSADKWQTRTTNKRNGQPLKHPVRELIARNVCHISASYKGEDGREYGDIELWRDAWNEPKPYTAQGILDTINRFAAVPYDGIEFYDVYPFM